MPRTTGDRPTSRPEAHIELHDVTKTYGHRPVLDNVRLTIRAGEFVVVVGRSGSGKSTLLNLISGLDRPSSGRIRLLDNDLAALSEAELALLRRRALGFVFQFFNLIPTLTVAENIQLPLALNGFDGARAASRVRELLAELSLDGCGERFPEELSGGEQQRVAIARAVAHEPQLVLADEPTGNLDLETAQNVIAMLDESCRRRGATLVMATHAREVIGLADRVFTIRNGMLEETTL